MRIRANSGVAGVLRDIVIGTSHTFDWVQVAGAIKHHEEGKKLDLSNDTNKRAKIDNASVVLYPFSGYGNEELIRFLIKEEKPDALMFMTDPRYYIWLFNIENEIRSQIPMIYLNIWDDLPYPMYNKSYYESCDGLLAISKQTENINKVVLGDKAKDKTIKYIPHGVDPNIFHPIDNTSIEWNDFQRFKTSLLGRDFKFTVLWNSRNIRRKSVSDLMISWKLFIDELPEEEAKECCLILHTNPIDENGTDLLAVNEMLFNYNEDNKYNVIFSHSKLPPNQMNYLYNCCDLVTLISDNEGWGLSLTEGMMVGKMILANVQGGMQDQMRFEDNKGKWINFNNSFPSNHRGTYKKCGEWALPVFPNNISLIGSVPTPYIYSSKPLNDDIAKQLRFAFDLEDEERKNRGLKGREWVLSEESGMSSPKMCENIIDGVNETLENFKPKPNLEIIKISKPLVSKHYVGFDLKY